MNFEEYAGFAQRAVGELYIGNMILQEQLAEKTKAISALMDEIKSLRDKPEEVSNAV